MRSFFLFDENSVDDAVLTRSAGNFCIAEVGPDDASLGDDVTSDVVFVGFVAGNGLTFSALGLAGLRIGDVDVVLTQESDFSVAAHGGNVLSLGRADPGLGEFTAVFEFSLASGKDFLSAGCFSLGSSLPSHDNYLWNEPERN